MKTCEKHACTVLINASCLQADQRKSLVESTTNVLDLILNHNRALGEVRIEAAMD